MFRGMSRDSVGFRGDLKLIRHRRGAGFWWQLRNRSRPTFLLGWLAVKLAYLFSKTTGIVTMVSELRLIKRTADGMIVDYGPVSYKLITTAGVNYLANAFAGQAGVLPANFKFHGWGGAQGTTANAPAAESKADIALAANLTATGYQTSSLAPSVIAGTAGADPTFTAQITTTFAQATVINEHGLFNQAAVSGATLWDRSVYANTPMAQNESMTFQYILTIQSGG